MVATEPGRHKLSDEDIQRIVGYTAGRWKSSGYDLEDLRSIANEAVAITILKYEPDRVLESHMGAYVTFFARLRMVGMMKSYRFRRARGRQFLNETDADRIEAAEPEDTDDAIVQKYLTSLDEQERALIQLRMDGYSFKQIAELLGVTRQAIHERLRTIRKRLSKIPRWQALYNRTRRGVVT